MKSLIATFIILILFGGRMAYAQDDYDQLWAEVDSLEQRGLPQSARAIALQIYENAVSDDNDVQTIKSLLFVSKYTALLEEDEANAVLGTLRSNLQNVDGAAEGLLNAVIGDLYWQYYQSRRFEILDRTYSPGSALPDDVGEWDARQLVQTSLDYFSRSLSFEELLKKTATIQYVALLQDKQVDYTFRPTLYDLVMHWAIDLWMHQDAGIARPQQPFSLNSHDMFLPVDAFIEVELRDTDSLSLQYQTTRLFQSLLRFRLAEDNVVALVDADLKRLRYMRDNSNIQDRDTVYLAALQKLRTKASDLEAGASVAAAIAEHLTQQANRYDPFGVDENHKWDKRDALSICEDVQKRWPGSRGAQVCISLTASIKTPTLSVETAAVVSVGKHFLARVQFSNVSEVETSLVKVSRESLDNLSRARTQEKRSILRSMMALGTTRRLNVILPNEGDYQLHSTEISFEPLDSGLYILIASAVDAQEQIEPGYTSLQVSDIGYVSRAREDGSIELLVARLSDGEPLTDAVVVLWNRTFRRTERDFLYERISEHGVDAQGHVKIPLSRDNQNLLSIEWSDQHLWTNQQLYALHRASKTEKRERSYLFTDRSIYRPGQTVHFKGILVDVEDNETALATGRESTVVFRDVNGQEIGKVELVSNEFGSLNGTFEIPGSLLPGQVSLSNGIGSVYFAVEEYKRPRFEVSLDGVSGTPVLGDEIVIEGSATSFFGSPITDGTVAYRVTRTPYFHPWWRFGRSIWPRSAPAEIAFGEAATDVDGSFSFSFIASPDDVAPVVDDPMFSFVVEVSVTDVSGETIVASSAVLVNRSGLVTALNGPNAFDLQNIPDISIIATNPGGTSVHATGAVQISRLETPTEVSRERLWAPVDTSILSTEDLQQFYPFDKLATDAEIPRPFGTPRSWPFDTATDTKVDREVLEDLAPGVYKFAISATDDSGKSSASEWTVTIYDSDSDLAPERKVFWTARDKQSVRVGETARLVLASGLNTRALFEIDIDGEIVESEWLKVDNRQRTIEIPVLDSFQGGFIVRIIAVQAGRVFVEERGFDVPFADRKLTISTSSFRSTLRPGAVEEWSFNVSSEDGSPVRAELMATLFDASLDELRPHNWTFDTTRRNSSRLHWITGSLWGTTSAHIGFRNAGHYPRQIAYPRFNWFGLTLNNRTVFMRSVGAQPMALTEEAEGLRSADTGDAAESDLREAEVESDNVQIRRNLSELAFFFPSVRTDSTGAAVISFTMPEALTRWRLLSLAHTTELKTGMYEAEVVTQKELMVVPNPPRFMRVGDEVEFSAKITNLSDSVQAGMVVFELENPADGSSAGNEFGLEHAAREFSVDPGSNTAVSWRITVPTGWEYVVYRVVATAERFSDGEEAALAILDNRMMVTESMPLWINGVGGKRYTFDHLQSPISNTIETYRVSLEYSSNPAWYAVQSLPYLADYPYKGAEHVFSRLYANAVGRMLVRTNPGIEETFLSWEKEYPAALESKLSVNEQLKAVVLSEAPWINDAMSEAERKRAVSSLFDEQNIQRSLYESVLRLEQLQLPNGAWPWFAGMRANRFVTQHIVKGLGWLRSLDALDLEGADARFSSMTREALKYLDFELLQDYQRLVDSSADLDEPHISSMQLHYLYARTLFRDFPFEAESDDVLDYYLEQTRRYWTKMSIYDKALASAILYRTDLEDDARSVLHSILEYAVVSEELGIYWKLSGGLRWNEAPIEIHAQVIASFLEVGVERDKVSLMQRWLLRNKQTHNWRSTRATTDAVYALLRADSKLLSQDGSVTVTVGDKIIEAGGSDSHPGTGYISHVWTGQDASADLGTVALSSSRSGPSWGALYWQYFEDVDKVVRSGGPLSVAKELFRKRATTEGLVLEPLSLDKPLSPGDLLTVELTIKADRDLEYVHLKDMRAAGTEPLATTSGFRWKSGLGFYEAISDASVSFFFDYLPRGTWVIEFDLRVNLNGDYSVGPARLQSMYAPEFVAFSDGSRMFVGKAIE